MLVAGPTASGKSALALELARHFGGEIVNADSMQVYRDLSIITARPEAGDLARAPHHLYGHVDGGVNHSVGRWREEAASLLGAIAGRGGVPIFVGGTGLYFKALEGGLAEMPAGSRSGARCRARHGGSLRDARSACPARARRRRERGDGCGRATASASCGRWR